MSLLQILHTDHISQKCERGKSFCVDNRLCSTPHKYCQYVMETSWKYVKNNSITWWYILKVSWAHLCKTSWRCLEDVIKTFLKRLEDVLKMSLRSFCKTSWRRLEDVWSRRMYWSWSRRLEDVFCRRMSKANKFVLIKTSWTRL